MIKMTNSSPLLKKRKEIYESDEKNKFFSLSNCAKYYKTYLFQQSRTNSFIKVKLYHPHIFHMLHICYFR